MFENETRDVILARMLDRMNASLDKSEGSVSFDMLSPGSVEFELFYQIADTILNLGFADTSSDYFLDLRCNEVGVFRKPGVKASGNVYVNGTPGITVPSGTQISDGQNPPLYFITTTDVVLDGTTGNGTLPAECELEGLFGNIDANFLSYVAGDLTNVVTVTGNDAFTGGLDMESDQELLDRYYDKVTAPSTSGNQNDYTIWTKSVNGVGDCLVNPVAYGAGTVQVIVIDSNGQPADSTLLTSVNDYIQTVRPIGADVHVEAATAVNINVSVTLTLDTGKTLTDVQPLVESAIAGYLKELAFNDPVVRYSKIANLIYDVDGVLDYDNLTVNSGTANITIPSGSVAIKGVVTLG
jgi:uncharacterized phage protein gp47/JayE